MAYGDGTLAAQAGYDLVSGGSQASTLDNEDNKTRDYLAELKLSLPRKITASTTAPASPQNGDVWIKVT